MLRIVANKLLSSHSDLQVQGCSGAHDLGFVSDTAPQSEHPGLPGFLRVSTLGSQDSLEIKVPLVASSFMPL